MTPAAELNTPKLRAWLATSSDSDNPAGETWADFIRLGTALASDDLPGLAASLLMWADLAGCLTTSPAIEGIQVIPTRDGDAHLEVALATGVVLSHTELGLAAEVGYLTDTDAAVAILARLVEAADEAVTLYRTAPVEV